MNRHHEDLHPYHTVGTVPKSNRKIAERCKIDIPNGRLQVFILCRF